MKVTEVIYFVSVWLSEAIEVKYYSAHQFPTDSRLSSWKFSSTI